jgi:histidinol-phosphatase
MQAGGVGLLNDQPVFRSRRMDEAARRELLAFAVESAQLAGAHTLGFFQANTPTELKADRTPVTAADRGAEERLRERITATYPDHGILGEEFGEQPGQGPGRWILDPVDGTQSFVCGVPLFAVLVAFEWEGAVEVGVIHLPALGETVYAAKGLGCWWNGRRARVSEVDRLADARVCCTSLKMIEREGRRAGYERLLAACGTDRGWSDAYMYALLATGRVDVALDPIMSIWDTAALLPVVTEAGGRLTDWSGVVDHRRPEVVATNGRLHDEVLGILGG